MERPETGCGTRHTGSSCIAVVAAAGERAIMRNASVVGVSWALVLGFAACGGDPCSGHRCDGDPCAATSRCIADPKPSEAEIRECQHAITPGAKCASEYRRATECLRANQVCDANDKTDSQATGAACVAEFEAIVHCESTHRGT